MPSLSKVLQDIDKIIPASWAEPWDNPGLQVGHPAASVTRIGITLDVTIRSLEIAEREDCQLLITHHPLLMAPPNRLDLETPFGQILVRAIRTGIGIVSLHTNWDAAPQGVNVCLANLLGLEEVEPLQHPESPGAWGMGAAGNLPARPTLENFSHSLCRFWDVSWVRSYGDPLRQIGRIAICGGSGASLVGEALEQKADLFITADMKYHQIQQALDRGLALCIVDHGEMEALSLDQLASTVTAATGLPARVLPDRAIPAPILSVTNMDVS